MIAHASLLNLGGWLGALVWGVALLAVVWLRSERRRAVRLFEELERASSQRRRQRGAS